MAGKKTDKDEKDKGVETKERPTIKLALDRDMEEGIVFLDDVEKDILGIESMLKKMILVIGDKEHPTRLPSQAVMKVFMDREALKSVLKSLKAVGATLGVYTASKGELIAALKYSDPSLFPLSDFRIDEKTGAVVYNPPETDEE